MRKGINPFHELYVSETIAPRDYVRLFSPFLVDHAEGLFRVGNVVVKGMQGSGKSMLLSLLKPEIQIAYYEEGVDFPVQGEQGRFLGAGINLTRSAAIDFANRTPVVAGHERVREDEMADQLAVYFGDFLNYWIVADMLESLQKLLVACEGRLAKAWGLVGSDEGKDDFAVFLARQDCWFGYLDRVESFSDLSQRIQGRLTTYRSFLNFNRKTLPEDFGATKTPIGEPIAKAAEGLRQCNLIPVNMPVFVRIDQYEEVGRLDLGDGDPRVELSFRRMMNKAMALREPKVSYRIGARRYSWKEDLRIFGSESDLEFERNYHVIDLDEILKRQENPRTWIFREFADDIFRRRLDFAGYPVGDRGRLTKAVFGSGPTSHEEAVAYAGSSPRKILNVEPKWPAAWRAYLAKTVKEEPLSAKLGEAWLRQAGGKRLQIKPPSTRSKGNAPWEAEHLSWWRHERTHQALMQIAASRQQRLRWAGESELHTLSGGNVLIFVSLCREIWAIWIRYRRTSDAADSVPEVVPQIDIEEQTVGVFQASEYWYEKITEQPDGHSYQRFVRLLGRTFRTKLLEDRAMAYPGHNGFSLPEEVLSDYPTIERFLSRGVDYGHLVDTTHTTKEKDRKPRRKWYLAPILSPHFQIPAKHKKEPLYVNVRQVWEWMILAEVREGMEEQMPRATRRLQTPAGQLDLFD